MLCPGLCYGWSLVFVSPVLVQTKRVVEMMLCQRCGKDVLGHELQQQMQGVAAVELASGPVRH